MLRRPPQSVDHHHSDVSVTTGLPANATSLQLALRPAGQEGKDRLSSMCCSLSPGATQRLCEYDCY